MSRALLTCLLGGFLLVACSLPPSSTSSDAGPAVDTTLDAGDVPLNLSPGGKGDNKLGATLTSSEVRAGQITDTAHLLSGIKVEGRVGDFKIYNDRVAFVIAGERETDGYSPYGGELLDAQRLDAPGTAGHSLMGETILGTGMQAMLAKSVGVINDGKDGKAAIVRVIGEPAAFPMLAGLLPTLNNGAAVHLVVDYVLEPGQDALELRWRIFNKRRTALEIPLTIMGFFAGDGLQFFADKAGFYLDNGAPQQDWVGLVGKGISYGVSGIDGQQLKPLILYKGIWVVSTGSVDLPAAGEVVKRFYLGVGGGTAESLRRLLRTLRGESEPAEVAGTVRDPATKAVVGANVHARHDDKDKSYATMARTDKDGKYAMSLAPGTYLLTVVADGRVVSDDTKITIDKSPIIQDLTLGDLVTVSFTVKDEKNQAIPAKLIFEPKTKPPAPPRAFGEKSYPNGAARVIFHTGGAGQTTLAPGEYTVTASRGFEYEIDTQTLTIAAGETKALALKLTRSVDTTGYMCGDFHVHAAASPDSNDLYTYKVSSFVAEGLELPVATDHEYIADYNPTIVKLGLQKWVYGIVGEELTTFVYGHFNPYPIVADDTKRNRGAVQWWGRLPSELFADVRKAWPNAVLEINHPRGQPISAYLEYVGYDPATGKVKRPDQWSMNFDALEVFNSSHWSANKNGNVRDWFSFLDRGKRVTGVGNSDSHSSLRTEVGYPRNYVKLSTDIPQNVDLAEFALAIKNQRVIISGGPFVTVDIGGKGLGELVDATAKKVMLQVKIQAPAWISVDTLRVIIGGKDGGDEVKTVTVDASTASPTNPTVRFDKGVEIALTKDTWVIVVVEGNGTLDPVVRGGRPFAVTNPIFLDVDGNGKYDAPFTF